MKTPRMPIGWVWDDVGGTASKKFAKDAISAYVFRNRGGWAWTAKIGKDHLAWGNTSEPDTSALAAENAIGSWAIEIAKGVAETQGETPNAD